MSSQRSTVARRCAMTIPVRPSISASMASSMCRSVAGSSRDDASSRMTRPGSRRNTRANASNWASPAESSSPRISESRPARSPGTRDGRRSHVLSPIRSRTASIRESSIESSKNVRLSRTDAWKSCTSCVTIVDRRRMSSRSADRRSIPPTLTAPPVGS